MLTVGVVMQDPEFRDVLVATIQGIPARVAFAVADASREAEKVERTAPDVLILDFGDPASHEVLAKLKELPAPPVVIGAHVDGDPEIILNALREGAREFVFPPLKPDALKRAIESIATERTSLNTLREKARTVAFLSSGGGCGATTLACHVAAGLRKLDAGRVLLADLELATGAAGFWMRGPRNGHSVLDAIYGLPQMDESLWQRMVNSIQPGLDLLAAPNDIPMGGLPGSRGFSDVLRIARGRYDWVIGDLGQNLSALTGALIPEFTNLVVVATAAPSSLYQAGRIATKLMQLGFDPGRIKLVLNRVHADQVREAEGLQKTLGLPAEMVIPEDRIGVAEALSAGRLVADKTACGQHMSRFAAGLAGKRFEEPARPSRLSVLKFW